MPRRTMKIADVEHLMSLRDLAKADLLDHIGVSADDVSDGYGYQSMTDLARVVSTSHHDARFFFDGDSLVMIAVLDPPISADALRSLMGADVVELRSRQGKTANIEVDPSLGLAFSADDDEVGFLEVFPPTNADDYRTRIYWDPGPFTK